MARRVIRGDRRTLPSTATAERHTCSRFSGDYVVHGHPYRSRRERAEEAMTAQASSSEARIAHSKLALLHGKAADRAVAATLRAVEGKAPLSVSVEL